MTGGIAKRRRVRFVYLLLAVPFAAMFAIGFYNRGEPAIAGIPFFYWYQLLWIPLGALFLLPVYRAEERARRDDANGRDAP